NRTASGHRSQVGNSLAAVIPKKSEQPATPLAQVFRGFVAFAVFILAAAAAAEFFFPDKIPFFHRSGKVGVPIGVPDASRFASAPAQPNNVAPVPPNQPKSNASPAIAAGNQNASPGVEQTKTSKASAPETATTPVTASTAAQIASVSQQPEPAPPAAGSNKPPSAAENSEQSRQSSESTVQSKKKTSASNRTSTSRSARTNRALPYDDEYGRGPNYQGRPHVARVIG